MGPERRSSKPRKREFSPRGGYRRPLRAELLEDRRLLSPLPAPTGLNASVTGRQSISVSWNTVSGATAYVLDRSTSPNGPWAEVYSGPAAQCADSGLQPGTTYYYEVLAGAGTESSVASSWFSASTLGTETPGSTDLVPAACLDEPGGWKFPAMCRLPDGNLLILYGNNADLCARVSSDGGIAWGGEQTVLAGAGYGETEGVAPSGVCVLSGSDTVLALAYTPYATATGAPYADVNGQADVLYSITGTYDPSTQTVNWATPVQFIAGPADGIPSGGYVDVNTGVSAPLELSDGSVLYPVYRPAADAGGNILVASWSVDVWRATAVGGNWDSPTWTQYSTIVAQDPSANEACLVQVGNRLAALVRYDDAAANDSSIEIWTSTDNGLTWSTNNTQYLVTAYGNIAAPAAIVMPSGLICLTTGAGPPGWRQAAVYFSNDLQNWCGPVELPGDCSYGGYGEGTAISGSELLVAQNTAPGVVTLASFIDTSPLTVTWSGGGCDTNWSTAANWGSAANWGGAAAATDEYLDFTGSARLSNTNDLAAGTQFGSLTFNAGAGAFTLSGNSVDLGSDIANDSTNTQTIDLPLVLTDELTLSAAAGDLTIAGNISETGGSQGVVVAGSATVTLSAVNSYSGGTVVSSGTLVIAGPSALPEGSALTVGAGGDFVFGPSAAASTTISPATGATAISTADISGTSKTALVPVDRRLSAAPPSADAFVSPAGLASAPAAEAAVPRQSASVGTSLAAIHDAAVQAVMIRRCAADLESLQGTWNALSLAGQADKKTRAIQAWDSVLAEYGQE